MQTWELKVTLKVADTWVADGFDAKERITQIEEALHQLLPYAHHSELRVKAEIFIMPTTNTIKGLQDGSINPKD